MADLLNSFEGELLKANLAGESSFRRLVVESFSAAKVKRCRVGSKAETNAHNYYGGGSR